MEQTRKHIENIIRDIFSLKTKLSGMSDIFIEHEGQTRFEEMHLFYDDAIEKLTAEKLSMPTGHRYTGTFYVRKPCTSPIEFNKIQGSLFMREDLSSWKIENNEDYRWSYYREAYRKPKLQEAYLIKRTDGEPVFETMVEEETGIIQ